MEDFTKGKIPRHLIRSSMPIAIGMLAQTLYHLVDLYFVGQLGEKHLAGTSTAGSIVMISIALTQVLSIGTSTLISHSFGAKNISHCNDVFNQSLMLSFIASFIVLLTGYLTCNTYLTFIAADRYVVEFGKEYIYWFLPSILFQFYNASVGGAMRSVGMFHTLALISTATVIMNALLSPLLINGVLTGSPLGVAGAGLATTVSVALGALMTTLVFIRNNQHFSIIPVKWIPMKSIIVRIFSIGIPAGLELAFLIINMAIIYWVIQRFGSSSQAAFGLGSKILQAIFLPSLAISYAAFCLTTQNYGAKDYLRVVSTFWFALLFNCLVMASLTLICYSAPSFFTSLFSNEVDVIDISIIFLKINSLCFIAYGVIYLCSSFFQALGNTWPSLLSKCLASAILFLSVIYFDKTSSVTIDNIWQIQVLVCFIQAIFSFFLLKREIKIRMGRRLTIFRPATA